MSRPGRRRSRSVGERGEIADSTQPQRLTPLEPASGASGRRKAGAPGQRKFGGSGPRVGRPSLLTAEAHENIVRALRAGNTVKASVEAFGISYTTAARWIVDGTAHEQGELTTAQRENGAKPTAAERPCAGLDEFSEKGEVRRRCSSGLHPYREFREAVVRGRAEAQLLLVARLQDAVKAGNASAALAVLRQIAPEEWGETRKVRIQGVGGPSSVGSGPPLIIELEHSDRDPKELAEIMATLEEG